MGVIITIVYIALIHLSVAALLPALAPYRIMLIVAALGLLTSLLSLLTRGRPPMALQILLMIAFTGWVGAAWIPHGWYGGAVASLLKFLPTAIVFLLVVCTISTPRHIRLVLISMVLIALFQTIQGVTAYWIGDPENRLLFQQTVFVNEIPTKTFLRVRYVGVLADPNDFAQYLITMLPFLGLLWKPGNLLRNIVLVFVPGSLLLYGVYLTGSRGALVGLVILVVLAVKDRFGKITSAVALTALVASLIVFGSAAGRDITFSAGIDRVNIWSDGLGMFKQSPVWGVGFGGFLETSSQTAHNSYLLCLAELGIVGYFFWLGLVVLTLRQLLQLRHAPTDASEESEKVRRAANVIYLAFSAYLACSFFLSRTYEALFYVFFGLGVALKSMSGPRPEEASGHLGFLHRLPWPVLTVILEFATIAILYASVRMR